MKIDNQYSSDPLLIPWYETADKESLIRETKDFLSAMFKADDETKRSEIGLIFSRRLLGPVTSDVIATVDTLLSRAIRSLGTGDGRAAMEGFASIREALGKSYGLPFPLPPSVPDEEAIVDSDFDTENDPESDTARLSESPMVISEDEQGVDTVPLTSRLQNASLAASSRVTAHRNDDQSAPTEMSGFARPPARWLTHPDAHHTHKVYAAPPFGSEETSKPGYFETYPPSIRLSDTSRLYCPPGCTDARHFGPSSQATFAAPIRSAIPV